jgi:hypothetical protein
MYPAFKAATVRAAAICFFSNMRNLVCLALFAGSVIGAPRKIDFNREVRPILSDHCFACHGPDDGARKAGLRLDSKEGILRVVQPGNTAGSKLITRITAEQKALRMPPLSTGRTLTDAQIATMKEWIAQGAAWESHWAYVPPRRTEPPPVKFAKWPKNEIDRFVLARLEREGLKPSPEADRATLLRRLSFDLTGLPPTPAEIAEFVKDKRPDAYERQVDRLLASPHYGERMAMQWLDLARYADTHGYHIDSHREMWPWRDWVIGAFNKNMRFDQFVVEQLAGDLLDKPTREQKLATGFNRNHMINFEGGAIEEEYQVEYVMDRVDATSSVFMGMTMGCARCHDHKYDPISQKDFYRFFALFNNVPERGLDGRRGNAEPKMLLPDAAQERALEENKAKLASLRSILANDKIWPLQAQWEQQAAVEGASSDGIMTHFEFDGNLNDSSGGYRHGKVLKGNVSFPNGLVSQALGLDGLSRVEFPDAAPLSTRAPFALSMWVKPNTSHTPDLKAEMGLMKRTGSNGWELYMFDGLLGPRYKIGARLGMRIGSREVRSKDRPLLIDQWNYVALSFDGTNFRWFVNGQPVEAEISARQEFAEGSGPAALVMGEVGTPMVFRGAFDDVRVYRRGLTAQDVTALMEAEPARAALRMAAGSRSGDQNKMLRDYYLAHGATQELKDAAVQFKRAEHEAEDLELTVTNVMVMAESAKPRETHVLGRGDYQNKKDVVTAGTPAVLPPLPAGAPVNRLGVAQWLVDPAHPLTARVAVNRYWQQYFGTGLVKTSEDFGSQGEPPSHPELLDWLATEFVRTGWDVKAMQRLVVTSATYRQQSKGTPALLEHDPENRLLARGPRFRLPAEMVRDNALAAAGMLNEKIGGPSVKPYQPAGLWEDIAFGGPYTAQAYVQDHGDALYRRSLYTFWKRTAPPASLSAFDAPNREKCVARRAVTNTPLQALVLMNDPEFLEAARFLAQRILREGGKEEIARLQYGFQLATGRPASKQEVAILRKLYAKQLDSYGGDQVKTAQLLSIGEGKTDSNLPKAEMAAWTSVASVLLSLDETITKE